MKAISLLLLGAAVWMIAGFGTTDSHISLADLHPTAPGSAVYDPTNNWTIISNSGCSWCLSGDHTNVMFYPEHMPHSVPAWIFERFFKQGSSETAVAVNYLGQKEGYAYLCIISIPVAHPGKKREKIVYVKLSDLDFTFRDALPSNPPDKK